MPRRGRAPEHCYFKLEGPHLLLSPCDETPVEPGDVRPDPLDVARALERVEAVTGLGLRSVQSSWSGIRSFVPDRVPVIGSWPQHPGFHFFAGRGGFGIESAPALAALGAATIIGCSPPPDISLDPAALAPTRLAWVPRKSGAGLAIEVIPRRRCISAGIRSRDCRLLIACRLHFHPARQDHGIGGSMAIDESYQARASAQRAELLAATTSPYTIDVRFLGGLTETQKAAFTAAADRWVKVIVGDLPSMLVDGEVIDDVLILAQGTPIDGVGGTLGQAGPTHLRPASAGQAALLPAKGLMSFDTADLGQMEANGTLRDVITHEMGHVIGIGTVWRRKSLLNGAGTTDPRFTGTQATAEYKLLGGTGSGAGVPVENTGGPGTADSHWRETIFRNELMSGFISGTGNPISRMTVGSLADLGYQVDLDAAEPYQLPNLLQLAEEGLLVAHLAPIDAGVMLPIVPIVLPEDSLRS